MIGRFAGTVVLLSFLIPAPASAQGPVLRLDQLSRLAEQAINVVDVTVDPALLQMAAGFLANQRPDDAAAKELIEGLKGVYVKQFEFEAEGAYTDADVESVREQLKAPWARIVNVKSRRDGENVEVYAWHEGDVPGGLAVVVAEPKSLTVVNVVGRIDFEKLGALAGQFGIPDLPK